MRIQRPEHVVQISSKFFDPSGKERMNALLDAILPKVVWSVVMEDFANKWYQNITVHETKEKHLFFRRTVVKIEITSLRVSIMCYRGEQPLGANPDPVMAIHQLDLGAKSLTSRRDVHETRYRAGGHIIFRHWL